MANNSRGRGCLQTGKELTPTTLTCHTQSLNVYLFFSVSHHPPLWLFSGKKKILLQILLHSMHSDFGRVICALWPVGQWSVFLLLIWYRESLDWPISDNWDPSSRSSSMFLCKSQPAQAAWTLLGLGVGSCEWQNIGGGWARLPA